MEGLWIKTFFTNITQAISSICLLQYKVQQQHISITLASLVIFVIIFFIILVMNVHYKRSYVKWLLFFIIIFIEIVLKNTKYAIRSITSSKLSSIYQILITIYCLTYIANECINSISLKWLGKYLSWLYVTLSVLVSPYFTRPNRIRKTTYARHQNSIIWTKHLRRKPPQRWFKSILSVK